MGKNEHLLTAIRSFAVLVYGYSIYFQEITPNPFNIHYLGKLKFLTYWDLLLQFSFFTLLLVTQSLLKIKKNSIIKLIDTLFFSLALPVSLIVSVTFWILYAIDREIILPVAIEKYYPVWLNHSTHTLVAILPLVEMLLGNYKRPSNKLGLSILNIFMISYLLLILYLALVDDLWVYPFLNLLNWPQRIAFFIVNFMFTSGCYFVGIYANKSLTVTSNNRSYKPKHR